MTESSMNGKVVVITGGSRGLGKALAELLSAKKAKVVIFGRNESDLKAVADKNDAIAVVGDVTIEKDVEELANKAVSHFGRIDIWINNSGVWLPRMPIEQVDLKRAHYMVEVNLFGCVYGSKAVLMNMKDKGDGMIVNISSTAALQGRADSAMYCASKHALKGFTDSIRDEFKRYGIKVIAVYPGGTKTNLFDEAKPEDYDKFMEPSFVALKIVENLEKENPEEEQVLKRPGQVMKQK